MTSSASSNGATPSRSGPTASVVRSVAELDAGSTLVTRFADGRARSTVEATEHRSTSEGQR